MGQLDFTALSCESSLSIPCAEIPFIHFYLPDCSVPALTRPICTAFPAAHVCHYSDEAVTLRIHGPCRAPLSLCSRVQWAVPSPGFGHRAASRATACPAVCRQLFCLCVHAQRSAVSTLSPTAHLSVHRPSEVTLDAEPFCEHLSVH